MFQICSHWRQYRCTISLFRKSIPKRFDASELKPPVTAIKDMKMFRLSWVVLGVLLIGYFTSEFIGIPVSLVAGVVLIFFLIMASRSSAVPTALVVREAPWAIVFFSIGMYVVVYGLRNVGLTDLMAVVIQAVADQGLFAATIGMGFIVAIISSLMNNMPTVLIDALAIDATTATGTVRGGAYLRQYYWIRPRSQDYPDRFTGDAALASCA
ncbi:ArsB/NhaD family transporter [Paenibacillus amylolyticus]|nr:ArsB/NhaD family transporter [Paenibacillus amylolyticus]